MSDALPQVTILPPSTKKRRRPALSCEQCRRRKVRCDRLSPCTTCVQAGNRECSYASLPHRPVAAGLAPQGPPQLPDAGVVMAETSPSSAASSHLPTSGSGRSVGDEWRNGNVFPPNSIWVGDGRNGEDSASLDASVLADRIRHLEWQVESFKRQSSPSVCRSLKEGLPKKVKLEKTRFLGPSHWIHGCCLVCCSPFPNRFQFLFVPFFFF